MLAANLPILPKGWAAQYPLKHAKAFVQTTANSVFDVGDSTPSPGVVTPAEMRGAYGLTGLTVNGIAGTGAGQTIAIVDAYDDPTALADLTTFDSYYGLAAPPSFQKMNQDGVFITAANANTAAPTTDPAGPAYLTGQSTWELEESLDIDWAHVMAPNANIILVEANSAGNDLYTAVKAAAQVPTVSVISMSWSGSEFVNESQFDSTYFTTPATKLASGEGVTFVSATGDSGADTETVNGSLVPDPQYPAASPNVVAVGGTTLHLNSDGSYGSETGWGLNGALADLDPQGDGGSGGGISLYEKAPSYQTFVTHDVGSGMRVYPDVSMEADPATGVAIVDSYDTGTPDTPWISPIGGTSLATPMFSAVIAIADQFRVANTQGSLGTLDGPSQTLPHIYELPDNALHDITAAGNNGYAVGPGYDLVTGRGSPVGNILIVDMASSYIGYHVFDDLNADGIQGANEPGLPNITVSLETTAGAVVQTTSTDADGFYQFLDPAVGTYIVHFAIPSKFQFSPLSTTPDPILSSTVTPATGNVTVQITGNGSPVGFESDRTDANCGMYEGLIDIAGGTVNRPLSGTTTLTFTVTLNETPTAGSITIPYHTLDGTAAITTDVTGPATTAAGDYDSAQGSLIFAPGDLSKTISVVILAKTEIEKALVFSVVIEPPSSDFDTANSTTSADGVIINTTYPAVSIATTSEDTLPRLANAIQTMKFFVTLSAPAPYPVWVNYTTTDVTATATIDYEKTTGTLIFNVDPSTGLTSDLTQEVDVPILAGNNPQLDKQFAFNAQGIPTLTTLPTTVIIPPIAGGVIDGVTTSAQSQAIGTIVSNVAPTLSALPGSVTESLTGTTQLPFVVQVGNSLTDSVSISYTTSDGTAVAGTDYGAVSGTLTFTPGQLTQTVFVPVYRQFLSAQDKMLSLTISNPSSPMQLVAPTAVGTIHYLPVTTLPVSKTQKAIYTDSLGQKVTISMTGTGAGSVVFLGTDAGATNAYELSFTGTTPTTNVNVSVSGGGQTTVNSVIVTGSLNNFSAKGLNAQAGVLSVSGTINSLVAGYLGATTVTLGGSPSSKGVSINLNRAVDTPITSGAPIRTLVAGAYVNSSSTVPLYITAPSVGTVRVAGNLGATIRTSGTVTALDVAGTITGGVVAGQGIGSVTADSLSGAVLTAGADDGSGTVADTAFANSSALIGRVKVKSSFSDSLIAGPHVGKVTLGSVLVTDTGTPFGIVGQHIASVQTVTSTGPVVNVANPQAAYKFQDFEVDLI